MPIITDSKNETVSFPPIINAAVTTVTTKTKNLFVEVTGINKADAEDMLSVVATILTKCRIYFGRSKNFRFKKLYSKIRIKENDC